MRSNSTLAILLTLIMLLLVSAAALFFLVQRNRQLEADVQQISDQAEEQRVASLATREQLESDVTVRQAALSAASATRDSLAAEAELSDHRRQELESSLSLQSEKLAEAQATLQSLSLQVFLLSPVDGKTFPPLEPLEIMAVVRADAGLNLLVLSANGQEIARLPGEGLNSLTARSNWTPPVEGTFVISAEAFTADGLAESAEVTISAAYASDEAREAALQAQLESVASDLRYPVSSQPEGDTAVAADTEVADRSLHRLLLTGHEVNNAQAITDQAYTLQALELIASDAGYRTYLDSVEAGDLATYFDPADGSLTVYEPGEQAGAFGRWLGIHDLAHDLQVERFGLDELDIRAMDDDRRLALGALVEGDAVFLQHLLLVNESLPAADVTEVSAGLAESATDVTAALPIPLQARFEFPYAKGVPFIQHLYDQGGFDLVDGAWRELPASSEQILHPDRYLERDMPALVFLSSLNETLGEGWRLVNEDSFGEFLLRQHLRRQPLTAEAIDLAATGWGGGRYAVYQGADSDIPVVVIRLAWDTAEDLDEFSELYADYLEQRYVGGETPLGEGQVGRCWQADGAGCLFPSGEGSLIIRAPNLELALAIAEDQLNISRP